MSADAAPSPEAPPPLAAFGAEAFAAAVSATPAQMADLEQFRVMLGAANTQMNLVGPSAMEAFWLRHAYDSAQLLAAEPEAKTWADLGAGAGFPGLVLAILLKPVAGARVQLVESMAKRCRFLEAVVSELDLPAEVRLGRAEAMVPAPKVEVVTARACAPLTKLFGFAWPFFRAGARGAFLKGRDVEEELTEARRHWRFQAELTQSLSDPSGRVVRIERLARG